MPENLADSIPKDNLSLNRLRFISHLNSHKLDHYPFFSKQKGVGGKIPWPGQLAPRGVKIPWSGQLAPRPLILLPFRKIVYHLIDFPIEQSFKNA